jgi:trehalose/maltose hydrolase-like predicted phosphorylase
VVLACVLIVASVALVADPAASVPSGGVAPAPAATDPCPGEGGGADAGWTLSTSTFDPAFARHAFVGNGYLSQRVPSTGMGYLETGEKTGWPLYTPRYTGAFVAGLYSADPQLAEGRHAYAAIPTWSTLTLGVGAETYTPSTPAGNISNFEQSLHLRCGLLRTSLTWTTNDGRPTDVVYDVIAHREDEHVGAVRLSIVPHWDGEATVTDLLDGGGARRVAHAGGGARGGDMTVDVTFSTLTTNTAGAIASTLRHGARVEPSSTERSDQAQNLTASQAVTFPVRQRESYELVKYVGVDTALTSTNPEASAVSASQHAAEEGWPGLLRSHADAWADLWRSDIVVSGSPDLQAWVRSGLYGLLSSVRAGGEESVAPSGLSSDNYAGLVFWDAEIWMYPSLLLLHPEIAKSVVEYRSKTLAGARANAQKLGYPGVFYPWTSAGTGDLESECHSVDPPHCVTQIHLQGDIALATWQYYLATKDDAWLRNTGWPVLRGIAEFWAGRVTANSDGSYSITNVAGPDEYSNGVTDGVFTNAGAASALRNATRAAAVLGEQAPEQWTTIADHLRLPFDPARQVYLQYEGYQGSKIKQADTVLLIYPLEWPMPPEAASNTLDHYAPLTDPDGPAMTDAVHAVDAAAIGEPGCATHTYLMRAIRPFVREPFAQFSEARGARAGAEDPLAGAPAFNFLTGSGGLAQVFTHGLTGLRWREDHVRLDPLLPPQLSGGVTLTGLHWQGRTFDVEIGPDASRVTLRSGDPFEVESPEGTQVVSRGAPLSLKTRRPDLAPTDNVARCAPATASSEEPGLYAEAAVDGSEATVWVPDAADGSLSVDLGRVIQVSRIAPRWTEATPIASRVVTSVDGSNWVEAPAADPSGRLAQSVLSRHVRIDLTQASGEDPTGIRELEVNGQ